MYKLKWLINRVKQGKLRLKQQISLVFTPTAAAFPAAGKKAKKLSVS